MKTFTVVSALYTPRGNEIMYNTKTTNVKWLNKLET